MQTMIENWINGNLTAARKQARRFSLAKIESALLEQGFSPLKSLRVAVWLKTGEGWQQACDAE